MFEYDLKKTIKGLPFYSYEGKQNVTENVAFLYSFLGQIQTLFKVLIFFHVPFYFRYSAFNHPAGDICD